MAAKDAISHVQMTLPGVDQWEVDARKEAVNKINIEPINSKSSDGDKVRKALLSTRMPSTVLGKAASTVDKIEYNHNFPEDNWAGYFDNSSGKNVISINANWFNDDENAKNLPSTLVHEVGHSVDSTNRRGTDIDFLNTNYNDKRIDPRLEGVADGMADRYVRTDHNFENQTKTGYGTNSKVGHGASDWTPEEMAVYHATRAHTATTGESIALDKPGPHPEGAYLHKLMGHSEAVEKALKDTGFLSHAQSAIYRYKNSRKVGTQLSFFGDADYDVYDFPDSHMGPQFRKGQPSS